MDLETSIDIKDEPLLDDSDMENQDGEGASKRDIEILNVEDLPEDYFADLIGLNVLDEWIEGEDEEEQENVNETVTASNSDQKKTSESVPQGPSKQNRSPHTEALNKEKKVKTSATGNVINAATVLNENKIDSQPQLMQKVKIERKSPINDDDEDTVPFNAGPMPVSGDNVNGSKNTPNDASSFDISACLRQELSKSIPKSISQPAKSDTAITSAVLSTKKPLPQGDMLQKNKESVEKNKSAMEKSKATEKSRPSSEKNKQAAEKSIGNDPRFISKDGTKLTEKKSSENKSFTENKSLQQKSSIENKSSERKSSIENKSSERKPSIENKLTERKSATESISSEWKSSSEKSSERKPSVENKSSERKSSFENKSSESKSSTENKSSEQKSLSEIKASRDNKPQLDARNKKRESPKHHQSKPSKSPERKTTPISVLLADKSNQSISTGPQPLMGINFNESIVQQQRPSSPNRRSPRFSHSPRHSPERKHRPRRSPIHRRSRSPDSRRRVSHTPPRMSPSRRKRRSISRSPVRGYSRSPRSRSITRRSRSPRRRSPSTARLDNRRKRQRSRSRSGSPMSMSRSPTPTRRTSPFYPIPKRSRSPWGPDNWDDVKEAAFNQTANSRPTVHSYGPSAYLDPSTQTQPPNLATPTQQEIQPFYSMNMPQQQQQQLPLSHDPMNFQQQGSYYPQPGFDFAGPSYQPHLSSFQPLVPNFPPDATPHFQPGGHFRPQPMEMNFMMNMPSQQPIVPTTQSYSAPVPQPVPPPTEKLAQPAPPFPPPALGPPSIHPSKDISMPGPSSLRVVSLDKMKNKMYNPAVKESSSSDSEDDEYEIAGIPTDVRLSSFLEATLDASKKAPVKTHIVAKVDKTLNILDADISLMQPVPFAVKRNHIIDTVPRNFVCRAKTNQSLLAKAATVDAALTPTISKINIRAIRIPESPKFLPQKRLHEKNRKPVVTTASIGTMTDRIPSPPPPKCLACCLRNEKELVNRWTQTLGVPKHSIYVQVGRSLEVTHDPVAFRNRSSGAVREVVVLDDDVPLNFLPRSTMPKPPPAPSPPSFLQETRDPGFLPPHNERRHSPPRGFENYRMHHRREVEVSRRYDMPRYHDLDRPVEDDLPGVSSRGNIRSRLAPPNEHISRYSKRY